MTTKWKLNHSHFYSHSLKVLEVPPCEPLKSPFSFFCFLGCLDLQYEKPNCNLLDLGNIPRRVPGFTWPGGLIFEWTLCAPTRRTGWPRRWKKIRLKPGLKDPQFLWQCRYPHAGSQKTNQKPRGDPYCQRKLETLGPRFAHPGVGCPWKNHLSPPVSDVLPDASVAPLPCVSPPAVII